MTQSGDVSGQIEGIRQQAANVLEELIATAGEFELADPPAALKQYHERLKENTYQVLVVGEAKRGKSTFVNALIGRDILPTDVDVATSQVFNIRPSEREAYRVRYEDGSVREILLEDLPHYGSRVMPGAEAIPTPKEIIRWIEVDVPIRFLPKGVSILDTPGLGALYAGHAQITYRFVPEADAVIFVLESGQPIIEDDLKFIEQILNVTSNIFFIQTKIDQYTKDDWQSIQRRNQEILFRSFKGQLADTRVWPVSSTNLRKAASADDNTEQAYLMASRHKELTAALQAFLARVSGWGRASEAMTLATTYHATGRQALAGRLAGLTAESKQKQVELQKVAVEGKQGFEAEWGVQGQKYRELREGLQRAMAVGKQSFANSMQPGNDIELAQKAKIDKISSLKQANRVREEMPGELVTGAMNNFAHVCEEVEQQCVALLGPFAEAIDDIGALVPPALSDFPMPSDAEDRFKHDYFTMIRSAGGGGMLVMGASGMAHMIVPSLAAAALAAPWALVLPLVALVGASIKGALSGQVKVAQGQLRMQLAEQLQKVRRHFFDVDQKTGRFSPVDEYFMTLERTVNEHVRQLVEKKSKESQAEIARLTQAIQLDEREREAQTKQTQAQLAKWDNMGKSIGVLAAQIKALQRPTGAATL